MAGCAIERALGAGDAGHPRLQHRRLGAAVIHQYHVRRAREPRGHVDDAAAPSAAKRALYLRAERRLAAMGGIVHCVSEGEAEAAEYEIDEARATWADLMQINPGFDFRTRLERLTLKDPGEADKVIACLAKAGLP